MLRQPKPQRVFLVTHKPITLACFDSTVADDCTFGRMCARRLFLNTVHDAGRSVASIIAMLSGRWRTSPSKGLSNCWLILRKPPTPMRARNSCSIRTSGTRSRWDKRANRRQARCSLSSFTSRLIECAGLNSRSRCVRQSWAALKARRRPPVGPLGHCPLINSSGIYGDKCSSSSTVPVIGKEVFTPRQTTPLKPTCRKPD